MNLNKKRKSAALLFIAGVAGNLAVAPLLQAAQKNIPYQAKTAATENSSGETSTDLDVYDLNHPGMVNMSCWLWQTGRGYRIAAHNGNGNLDISQHLRSGEHSSRQDYDALYAARAAFKRFKDKHICSQDSNSEKVWDWASAQADKEKRNQEKEKSKALEAANKEAELQRKQDAAARDAANKQPDKW